MTLTVPQIEAIRDKAVSFLTAGLTVMEYKDSGTDIRKDWPMDPPTVLLECRYALQIKEPEKYGRTDRVRVGNLLGNFRGL